MENINEKIIKKLASIIGESNLVIDREEMLEYTHDESLNLNRVSYPLVVVKPGDKKEVAEIMKYCNTERIPVTIRGGGTGLCGGAVPLNSEIIISLERMNKVIEIDSENMTATVEAGVRLSEFYKSIEKFNLFFPPHPGDEGATIGGIVATNAGGSRALKYGVVRNFVRALEFVIPTGMIFTTGGKFLKNSTGYNILNLLIGSEGTLAIITSITLALIPKPKFTQTLILAYNEIKDAILTMNNILKTGITPMAAEIIDRKVINIVESKINKKIPCEKGEILLLIILDGNNENEITNSAEIIGEIALNNNSLDVLVADTKNKQDTILQIRSNSYESLKKYMLEAFDISLPRSAIYKYLNEIKKIENENKVWLPTYGHIGDGNLHTHIMKADWNGEWIEKELTPEEVELISQKIYNIAKECNGILSGEHGIGFLKKKYLNLFIDSNLIEIMKSIKKVFDPNNILNPNKIF